MRGIMISCVSLVVQMLTLAVFITKIRTNRQRLGKLKDLHEVTSQVFIEDGIENLKGIVSIAFVVVTMKRL
ncbi:hypothetical protein V1264_024837 [Littorina saxatilis]|uniref:Uncharacterized protein n=1 Tax=Littorina saxatilis TaxID=31220 RepID=A0AAN9G0M5_9CAEN